MTLTARPRQAGPAQLAVLLAGSAMPILGAVLIAPVLPQMAREFATTPGVGVLVTVVLTVPALMIGLIAPFAGMIVDAVDRKRLLLVTMIGYAVFGVAPVFLDSLTAIIASRVGVGICEAAIMTCCTTLIGDYWSGPRRGRYLGRQVLVAALSATVALAIGGALGASGWRTPFWLYAIAILIVVPMARLLWQPERPAAEATTERRLEPLPWRRLAGPWLLTLLGGVLFYSLIVELSFVLTDLGVTSTATIGLAAAVMSLSTAVATVVFGRLSGRGPGGILPGAFALTALGLIIVWLTGSVVVAVLGAVVWGFGTGLMLPTLVTWVMNRLTFGGRGRGMGIFNSLLFIGEFLCPLIVAAVGAGVGGLQPALGVLGIASAAMAVALTLGLRGSRERLDESHAAVPAV